MDRGCALRPAGWGARRQRLHSLTPRRAFFQRLRRRSVNAAPHAQPVFHRIFEPPRPTPDAVHVLYGGADPRGLFQPAIALSKNRPSCRGGERTQCRSPFAMMVMRRQPVESDFEVEIFKTAIAMRFWPTRSLYTFARFTSAREIAEFGRCRLIPTSSTPRAAAAPAPTTQRRCWGWRSGWRRRRRRRDNRFGSLRLARGRVAESVPYRAAPLRRRHCCDGDEKRAGPPQRPSGGSSFLL